MVHNNIFATNKIIRNWSMIRKNNDFHYIIETNYAYFYKWMYITIFILNNLLIVNKYSININIRFNYFHTVKFTIMK